MAKTEEGATRPISLTQAEREAPLSLRVFGHCDDSDCPLNEGIRRDGSHHGHKECLEGKSQGSFGGAAAGTNFGRDRHESALGSTVTSVQLSVARSTFYSRN